MATGTARAGARGREGGSRGGGCWRSASGRVESSATGVRITLGHTDLSLHCRRPYSLHFLSAASSMATAIVPHSVERKPARRGLQRAAACRVGAPTWTRRQRGFPRPGPTSRCVAELHLAVDRLGRGGGALRGRLWLEAAGLAPARARARGGLWQGPVSARCHRQPLRRARAASPRAT